MRLDIEGAPKHGCRTGLLDPYFDCQLMLACTRPPKQTWFIYATGHHEQDLPQMCYTQNHHQIHKYLICCPEEVLVLVAVKLLNSLKSPHGGPAMIIAKGAAIGSVSRSIL